MAHDPGNPGADSSAIERILPAVYEALRELAHRRLLSERKGQTLQTTELVHEAYLRLQSGGDTPWNSDAHFYCAAAEAMRRILIERARRRSRLRHGGGLARLNIEDHDVAVDVAHDNIIAISDALDELEKHDRRVADVVRLRFFVGFTVEETAEKLGVSPATVKLDWSFARAWLQRAIAEGQGGDGDG
ncbi:MAG: ECF-type sigma factor [Candidatus Krumholzibacteria bacterium]|nr:ECF-type sigma factor [Candidatus Krumholzibacteria bacterium]MDH4335957.1 ECF-type sigma factor [Candidatus Krumholzibacteria bacterium]MDH5268467.1 ECF-type sigma factor [Candidatus Krumholzibacteria bacterium]